MLESLRTHKVVEAGQHKGNPLREMPYCYHDAIEPYLADPADYNAKLALSATRYDLMDGWTPKGVSAKVISCSVESTRDPITTLTSSSRTQAPCGGFSGPIRNLSPVCGSPVDSAARGSPGTRSRPRGGR